MLLNRKKVMIVDPSPIFSRKLKATIQTNETLVDVIEAGTINAAEDILRNQQLDVVFLDIGFPQEQGVRLIDAIKGAARDMRVGLPVVYTGLSPPCSACSWAGVCLR